MSRKVLSLTEGNIRKVIISFAWPVFISSIFAELYNITNSMIVGNYVSLRALSAVSACTWICNIFNFTFFGLGMGTGIIVARYYGAKDYENLEKSLDTAIIFAVVGGIALTVLSEMFLPVLMKICNITGDIYGDARDYLRVYFLGNTAVLTSQMCFYILRSFGDTRHQLYFSIISSIVNVVLGVIFVRFLGMNITGTALATIISQFVMDILALRQMIRIDGVNFDIRNLHFSFRTVMEICRLGIPAGFQNMLIALSSMVVQSYVNMFPNEVIAGIGVGEKLTNWGQMYSVAVSSATMALVAQNLGAERYDRARESIRESAIISSAATLFSIVVLFVSAPLLVSRFSDSAEAVEYGVQMIRWSVFSMFFI
ncbi:MAG: MATE family efflux transporter, partial [Erysipelotrichaceae bacterium]|nr:MATE family efflux transporter [Erysipelotrichaceae bacterium]